MLAPILDPAQETREWLDFLNASPTSLESLESPTYSLECDALINATKGITQLGVMHQQEMESELELELEQEHEQQFVTENIEEKLQQAKDAQEFLAKEKPKKVVGTNDTSAPLDIKKLLDSHKEISAIIVSIQNSFDNLKKISEQALAKIIEHSDYFVDGVALDNLPAGFFYNKETNCLCFDQEAYVEAKKIAESTPSNGYDQAPLLFPVPKESEVAALTPEALKALLQQLSHPKSFLGPDSTLKPLNKSILTDLDFTEESLQNFLKAIAPVLNSSNGTVKVYTLLATLKKLQETNPRLYENIKKCFIDKSKDLSEIANLKTLNIIESLGKLPSEQQTWWCHLTEQHTNIQNISSGDIGYLYNTFMAFYKDLDEFWQAVYKKDLVLPEPCPIDSIGNMQVALNRIAYIVKHAANPQDQLQYLQAPAFSSDQPSEKPSNTLVTLDLQYAQKASIQTNPLRFILTDKKTSQQSHFCALIAKIYTDTPGETEVYFPNYSTVSIFWDHVQVLMQKFSEDHRAYIEPLLPDLTAYLLRHKVQSAKIFQFIETIAFCIEQASKLSQDAQAINSKLICLAQFPTFTDKDNAVHVNPKHLELLFKNSSTTPSTFLLTQQWLFGSQPSQRPPAEDIFTCLLAIKSIPDLDEETIKKITQEFNQLQPDTIAILARILSNTDFTNPAEDGLVTKEQLSQIIKLCTDLEENSPTPPTYENIKTIVNITCPSVKFLPDQEYIAELAKDSPKDLKEMIFLFKPLFDEAEISLVDSQDLLNFATMIIGQADANFMIPPLLGDNLVILRKALAGQNMEDSPLTATEKENTIITTILNIISSMKSWPIVGSKVEQHLKTIKEEQIEKTKKILTAQGFSPEDIEKFVAPLNSIDLTRADLTNENFIAELNKLLRITALIPNLLELKKYGWQPEIFITLVRDNFSKLQDDIDSLTDLVNIYTSTYPSATRPRFLNKKCFCSPDQVLKKILEFSPQKKLTPDHINLLRKIAEKQSGSTRISLEQLDLLLNIVIKLPPEKQDTINQLLDFSFAKDKYGDFPVGSFLKFAQNLSLEQLNTITDLIKTLQDGTTKEHRPTLNSFINLFLKNKVTAIPEEKINCIRQIQGFLPELRVQVFQIIEQLLTQAPTLTTDTISKIIIGFITLCNKKIGPDLFKKISSLYQQKPCPNSKALLDLLALLQITQKPENDIDQAIEEFVTKSATCPFGARSKKFIEENEQDLSFFEKLLKKDKKNPHFLGAQFSTSHVDQVIVGLGRQNPHLRGAFLQELRADFDYINAIGSTQNFPGAGKPVWKMTPDEIRAHLTTCTQTIQNLDISETERYLAKLQALALLREVLYRTSEKMPQSTQILSILLQTKHMEGVCMQINTGEGKSIINPLLAAMRHLEGYSVNVFTSNTLLATRDQKEATNFWSYLKIPVTFIDKSSHAKDYATHGINYTTPADFALFSAAVGETIATTEMGMAGVYDEADQAFYTSNLSFNFSQRIDTVGTDPFKNPFDWIYPLINKFIDNNTAYKEYLRQLDLVDNETDKQKLSFAIVNKLLQFLKSQSNPQQFELLNRFEESELANRLLRWLAAAESAKTLDHKFYHVGTMERDEYGELKKYSTVVVHDDEGHPLEGAILTNGAHQFLSARLQIQGSAIENQPFVIDPESVCISTTNTHTELARMKKVDGVTGTMGGDQLLESFQKLHPTIGIIVPPHNPNRREDKEVIFTENADDHTAKIIKNLKQDIAEPQLVIGANSEQCQKLFDQLKSFAQTNNITLILATADGYKKVKFNPDGQEIEIPLQDDYHAKGEDDNVCTQASQPRTITISTPILGRGVNIKGLKKVVKISFDPNERLEKQIEGRTGRYGAEGKTFRIYDWQETCQTYRRYLDDPDNDAKETDPKKRSLILETIRRKTQKEEMQKLFISSKVKEISVGYQDGINYAISQATIEQEKSSLQFVKHELIEKLELLYAKTFHGDSEQADTIHTYKKQAEKIWSDLAPPKAQAAYIFVKYRADFDRIGKQLKPSLRPAWLLKRKEFIDKLSKEYQFALEQLKTIPPKSVIARYKTAVDLHYATAKISYTSLLTETPQKDFEHILNVTELEQIPQIFQDDQELLVAQYNQKIYADKVATKLSDQEEPVILARFDRNLEKIRQKLKSTRWNAQKIKIADMPKIFALYITPYLKFTAQDWSGYNQDLAQQIMAKLNTHIEQSKANPDLKEAYWFYLSAAKLKIDRPNEKENFSDDIRHLQKSDKKIKLQALKEHLNKMPLESKEKILQKISGPTPVPTGNYLVDYYVILIRKYRGIFGANTYVNDKFGDTSTYQELRKYAQEELHKLQPITPREQTPQPPSILA